MLKKLVNKSTAFNRIKSNEFVGVFKIGIDGETIKIIVEELPLAN